MHRAVGAESRNEEGGKGKNFAGGNFNPEFKREGGRGRREEYRR